MRTLAVGLGCAGVLAQICYPLTSGSARDAVTVAVVLLLAGTCVAHAAATRGARWAAGLVLITAGGGLLAEFAGTSGFPFGSYAYTTQGALGPELAGVPLLIGPAWTFGAYPAWCAARALVGSARSRPGGGRPAGSHRAGLTVLVAAWALTSWDLYLDPQMVADGRWAWADPHPALPGLPQIALSNYAGWVLVALVMCACLHGLDRLLATPAPSKDRLPQVLFCWTWLGSAAAHAVLLDLPVSAGYGFVAMGVVGAPLLARLLTTTTGRRRRGVLRGRKRGPTRGRGEPHPPRPHPAAAR